jgi:hypothetical protein
MSIEACLTHDRERDRRPYLLIPCFAWLAACGSGQLPRPVLTGRVTVRLAHDDEFNDHPPSDPNDSFHLNWFLAPCPVTGEFAPELAQPVIEFARTNLISRPDNFAIDPTAPIDVRVIQPGHSEPSHQRGYEISIQPRARIGELLVANRWGDGEHVFNYCTHPLKEGNGTVIVVNEVWSGISSVGEPPDGFADVETPIDRDLHAVP